jgi:DNA-binding MarR family transcriptional regulator
MAVLEDPKRELTAQFVASMEFLNLQLHTGRLGGWEGLEITIPQFKTLVLLERMGPLRMSSIASYFDRALSAITAVMDRLVKKGLVARHSDPSDRRLVICELTDRGRRSIEEFWRIGPQRIERVVGMMDLEELKVAVEGLELVCRAERQIQRFPTAAID